MVDLRTFLAAALLALTAAAPAAAQWSTLDTSAEAAAGEAARRKPAPSRSIPEPANIVLFAAGVAGLLLGRRGSRSRHDGD